MKNLSEREKLILKFITKGMNNEEIGKILNISIHTVKIHITNILRKFNAKNRTEVAYLAGKFKFIE